MKKHKLFLFLLLFTALMAWPASYGPEMYRHHQAIAAMNETQPHWACLLDSSAVGYQYDGITTRPYILLGDTRYFSNEFWQWKLASTGRILLIVNGEGKLTWTRVPREEAIGMAEKLGIGMVGCRRMGETQATSAEPLSHNVHQATPIAFSWEKALAPMLAKPRTPRLP